MDNRKIERILRRNRRINAQFAGYFVSFTSLWNALFAPIIIGLGVSYVFQKKDINNGISDFFFIACIMFFILHLILAWGAKYLDKKDDATIELGDLTKEYNKRVSEIETIRKRMVQEDKLSTTQKLVIYLTTLQVNSHIRKILIANKEKKLTLADFPIDTASFFSTVLGYLSRNRETLF
ncbi:GAF domain-containing protein, partial [Escherichia coli]|nr:GAF domain-containing protein [Escherichia coli]